VLGKVLIPDASYPVSMVSGITEQRVEGAVFLSFYRSFFFLLDLVVLHKPCDVAERVEKTPDSHFPKQTQGPLLPD
jgi:hypothetical protein